MVRDDFYANLGIALGWLKNPTLGPVREWLRWETVEGYRAKDFDFLDTTSRTKLDTSVTAFRKIADSVPITEEPNDQQIADAKKELETILQITQPERYYALEAFRLEVKLKEALQGKLPEWVTGLKCRSENDFSGDPLVRLWVYVSDEAADQNLVSQEGTKMIKTIRNAIARLGIQTRVAIYFENLKELLESQGAKS